MKNAKTTPKTNVGMVVEMMNFSKAGGLKQAFVLTAIDHYSRQVLTSGAKWDNPLVSQEAWKMAAQECKESLDEHLGRAKVNATAVAAIAINKGV